MGENAGSRGKGYPGHRHEQLSIALEAEIESGSARCSLIQLRNLSSLGFIGETGDAFRPRSHIFVKLPGAGPREAVVHWSRGRCVGARFVERINLASVRAAAPDAF